MTELKAIASPAPSAVSVAATPPVSRAHRNAALVAAAAAVGVFASPLYHLASFAVQSSLYSHLPLILGLSAYLIWNQRAMLAQAGRSGRSWAILPALGAGGLLFTYAALREGAVTRPPEDEFALAAASFVLAVWAFALWLAGLGGVRVMRFPLLFLAFMIPLPAAALAAVDTFLQHGSAFVAALLFRAAGTAYFYQDLTFQLPGISIRVAPECSGIHSTLVLLIVSLLAGHWFVRSPARAALLALAVLPLALLRNGARIFTVSELCVYRGPDMIDSPLHRHGGPVFFAASLLPMLALLWLITRAERRT